MPRISVISVLIPTLLAAHGLRKKSLSLGGALAAFVAGFTMISGSTGTAGQDLGLKVWAVSLIGFYLLGSRATKYGKERKKVLEAGYHDYGNRSAWQVLSNSFSAVVACFAWNLLFVPQGVHVWIVGALAAGALEAPSDLVRPYGDDWCPLSKDVSGGWSRALLFAALGHFACCLGDTLASELGILSSSPPRLITTWKPVPPGTNGGVSVGGTLASLSGGIIMGLMMSICLILENSACVGAWVSLSKDLIVWGALGGLGGSGIDSLLGATIQMTRYDDERKLVVDDAAESDGKLKVIGGLNILTNNQVNVVSSVCSAIIIGLLA